MTLPSSAKLTSASSKCAHHAAVLLEAALTLPDRFNAPDIVGMDVEVRRSVDQLAYRFMKLQDGLGEKVLPGLLTATLVPLPPHATFVKKCVRLGRIGGAASNDESGPLRKG